MTNGTYHDVSTVALDDEEENFLEILPRPTEEAVTVPTTSGCWFQLPSGCKTRKWQPKSRNAYQLDIWAMENRNAGINGTACYQRRNDFNTWCGISNTQMYFKPVTVPTTPGCWVLLKTGCTKQGKKWQPKSRNAYQLDTWGMQHRKAGIDGRACAARTQDFNNWCGVRNAVLKFNPKLPTTPGCWILLPSGCTKQGKKWQPKSRSAYQLDTWGMNYKKAGINEKACAARKPTYNRWCGVKNGRIYFKPVTVPTTPGCWVLLQTGCTKQGKKWQPKSRNAYQLDTWGMQHRNAGIDVRACTARTQDFNNWCGVRNAVLKFNPNSLTTEAPEPATTAAPKDSLTTEAPEPATTAAPKATTEAATTGAVTTEAATIGAIGGWDDTSKTGCERCAAYAYRFGTSTKNACWNCKCGNTGVRICGCYHCKNAPAKISS